MTQEYLRVVAKSNHPDLLFGQQLATMLAATRTIRQIPLDRPTQVGHGQLDSIVDAGFAH